MAANVYKTCYCHKVLRVDDDEDADKGWECRSCRRLIKESINYWCTSGTSCPWRKLTGGIYMICSNCFNFDMRDESERKANESEPDDFISKKVLSTINIIR